MKTFGFVLSAMGFGALITLTGCGSSKDGLDTSDDRLSTATPLTPAHFAIDTPLPGSYAWVNEIFLLPDGKFDAQLGLGANSLSGHNFRAVGTYDVTASPAAAGLTLHYSAPWGEDISDEYLLSFSNDGSIQLQLMVDGKVDASNEAFTLHRVGSSDFAKIEFENNWTVQQAGSLVGTGILQIEYATKRAQCGVPDTDQSLTAHFAVDGKEIASNVFPREDGDHLTVAIEVPTGQKLSIWFESVATGGTPCTFWDSDYGKNFNFDIGK